MRLNDTKCKTATPLPSPSTSPRKVADGEGLSLWVYPNGAKRWRFDYRINGKRKVASLGVYPEVSLKEAREKKFEVRKTVAAGKDLSLERKKEKLMAAKNSNNTFESVAREWHEYHKSKWSERYANDILKRLDNDIFAEIGTYPIAEIEPPMLLQVIRKIEKRNAPDLAKRQLQKCGEIFRFAMHEGKISIDPSVHMSQALKPIKQKNYACIATKEIPEFISKIELNDARLYRYTRNALKLLMLTFVRTSELINMTWDEIDINEKVWTIPPERMKMKKEHIVPLSKQAIAIIEDQREIAGQWDFVFPSSIKPRKSMSNNTILGALRRLGYKGKMTGHGFRSLAMTGIMEELGYRFEVPDLQLAHVKGDKIRKAYDRTKFMDERVKMMQEWADYLENKGLRT